MPSKVVPLTLCIFGLLVIVLGQLQPPDNLDQYFKCWTFAECKSEGSALHGIEHCINMIPKKDLYPAFQYVNSTYDRYHTDSIEGAVQEYCNQNADAQMVSFEKTFKGLYSYVNILCSSPDTTKQCIKFQKALACLFTYLDQLRSESSCEHD